MTALVVLREKVIRPLLAASSQLASPSKLNRPDTDRPALRSSSGRHAQPVYRLGDRRIRIDNRFFIFADKLLGRPAGQGARRQLPNAALGHRRMAY
jgi:hypothetical protein